MSYKFIAPHPLFTCILRGTLITLTGQSWQRILYLGVSFQVMAWSFAYQLGSITSILPLYRTFTATAFSIYILIKVKSYSSSALTASSIQTLTVDLTSTTLGRCWGGAGWVSAVILAHKGFVVYIISIPYDFIVSLMYLSLSFIVLQFLLCLIYSS